MQFKIKICGVKSVDDALLAVDAGADAIGLNFYRGSKRCIHAEVAREIVDAIGARATCVGVFANATAGEIRAICETAGLSWVQLHGDERPELIRSIGSSYGIIRARRLDARGLQAIADDVAACRKVAGFSPAAVLADAAAAGQYGGTGHTVDWQLVAGYPAWLGETPLILAGGLTPANVAEAIRVVRPHAVDVASGVESSPGVKDVVKVRDFVAAARTAFAAI
jgi:phosphoribosylanthranilate isomerase